MKKYFYSFFALIIAFTLYITCFPNDFFLSTRAFSKKDSQYFYQKNFDKFIIYDKKLMTPNLQKIIQAPNTYLKQSKSLIKDNEKRTVSKLNVDSKDFIIKRYNYKNAFDWITKCPFRSSKAYRSWFYQHALQQEGIKTARPVAIVENRIGPFWLECYLISEYLPGESLDQVFLKITPSDCIEINNKLINALNLFYKKKWLHRDLVARNIIIHKDNLAIIDLDEMHSYFFNNQIFKKKFLNKHLLKLVHKSKLNNAFIKTFLMTHNQKSDYNIEAKKLQKI